MEPQRSLEKLALWKFCLVEILVGNKAAESGDVSPVLRQVVPMAKDGFVGQGLRPSWSVDCSLCGETA